MTNRGLVAPADRAVAADRLETGSPSGAWLAVALAHLLLVLWLFGGAVFSGRLLYFRDLSSQYAPDYAFAADSLRHGVWPLWNPTSNAGEPMLAGLSGRRRPAPARGGARAPRHGRRAAPRHRPRRRQLAGASARDGPLGGVGRGAVYGLGGFVLSTVSLVQLFQAAAWAPWVIAALPRGGAPARRPARRDPRDARRAAGEHLGAEIVLQTAVVGLVLAGLPAAARDRRRLCLLGAGALALALALAAPALLGARALLEGTAAGPRPSRPARRSPSRSTRVVLGEALLPKLPRRAPRLLRRRLLGARVLPRGLPVPALPLRRPAGAAAGAVRPRAAPAVVAGRGGRPALARRPRPARARCPRHMGAALARPAEALLPDHVASPCCPGSASSGALGRRSAARCGLLLLPGIGAARSSSSRCAPTRRRSRAALGRPVPPLADPRGHVAARDLWPAAWLARRRAAPSRPGSPCGAAVGGRALAGGLARPRPAASSTGASTRSPLAAFYDLRPDVAALVRPARAEGTVPLVLLRRRLHPGAALRAPPLPRTVGRLALLPRPPVAPAADPGARRAARGLRRGPDGLGSRRIDAAGGRGGARRFPRALHRLRLANVRWVLSSARCRRTSSPYAGEVRLPEIEPPLALYELRSALPRAFWVPRSSVEPDPERLRLRLEDPAFDPRSAVLVPASRRRSRRRPGRPDPRRSPTRRWTPTPSR